MSSAALSAGPLSTLLAQSRNGDPMAATVRLGQLLPMDEDALAPAEESAP